MPPRAVFVFDRENWCSVFPSVEDAESGLETADVEADEYVVFGEDGTVFGTRVEGPCALSSEWDDRWPKRPHWLARRLHGDDPPRI
jgi:hypothetical protein